MKTAVAKKARETKAEVTVFMKTYLEDTEALDGLEFLSMGRRRRAGALGNPRQTQRNRQRPRRRHVVKFALPLQQAHVAAVREHSVRLGDQDSHRVGLTADAGAPSN